MKLNLKNILFILTLFLFTNSVLYSAITVGLKTKMVGCYDDGYVLFTQINSKDIYLINKCGQVVHSWESAYQPGFEVSLQENGYLLHTICTNNQYFWLGGSGGGVELLDWDNKLIWRYKLSTHLQCQHHDAKMLPNGNILMLVWEKKLLEEFVDSGRDPNKTDTFLLNEKLIEIKPIGMDSAEIVWEWSAWDHLVQEFDSTKSNYGRVIEHPELININYNAIKQAPDWLHLNSIDYNEDLDQLLISVAFFNEVWIIDHSTSTLEAKGHTGGKYGKGGDILYRWGNKNSYGFGKQSERVFTTQHDAHWIKKGTKHIGEIIVFNNKCGSDPKNFYSSVDIFKPPLLADGSYNQSIPYGPDSVTWRYIAPTPTTFYSINLSSTQILPNDNLLICSGANGKFFELDSLNQKVWEYVNPVSPAGIIEQGIVPQINMVFRAKFYDSNFPAFADRDLSPKGIIENKNANSENCSLFLNVDEQTTAVEVEVFPNPANKEIHINTNASDFEVYIYDLYGKNILRAKDKKRIDIQNLNNGQYFIKLIDKNGNIFQNSFIVER